MVEVVAVEIVDDHAERAGADEGIEILSSKNTSTLTT